MNVLGYIRQSFFLLTMSFILGSCFVIAIGFGIALRSNYDHPPIIEIYPERTSEPTRSMVYTSVGTEYRTTFVPSEEAVAGLNWRKVTIKSSSKWHWSPIRKGNVDFGNRPHFYQEEAVGWPRLSFYWQHNGLNSEVSKGFVIKGTRSLKVSDTVGLGIMRVIPYGIWWPGFVANEIVFCSLVLSFGLALSWSKKRWRMKRGLCPVCAYDLRSDLKGGCSECGWRKGPSSATAKAQ